jgi:hypothetical protein
MSGFVGLGVRVVWQTTCRVFSLGEVFGFLENLVGRFAKTTLPGVSAFVVVSLQPPLQISLQFFERVVDFLA